MSTPVTFDATAMQRMDRERYSKLLDYYLKQAIADCNERPGLDKARKVVLTITLEPERDNRGLLETVNLGVRCDVKLPPTEALKYPLKPALDAAGDPCLQFMAEHPEDFRQPRLFNDPENKQSLAADETTKP